jgi:tetratricopeptide (TPR) repeat protein
VNGINPMECLMRTVRILALVLLIGISGAALGQTPEEAEKKSAEGRLFYDQGRFDLALERFREAFAIHPSERYLFNAAKACLRLDDREGAVYFYERYLAVNPAAGDRAAVEGELATLREGLLDGGLFEVRLLSTPSGATLLPPAGRTTRVEQTPGSLFLGPGRYVVRLQAEGYRELPVAIEVKASGPERVTIESTLEKPRPEPVEKGAGKVEERKSFPWQWVFLGVGGAGLATAGTGAWLWYDGWNGMGAANDKGGPTYVADYGSAKDRYVTGQWLVGAGAAVAVGGTLGFLLWPSDAKLKPPTVSFTPTDDGLFFGVTSVF